MQHWVHLLVQDPDNKDIELSNSIKNGVVSDDHDDVRQNEVRNNLDQ